MKYETILDTLDAINKATAALNVTPNGGTFTAKDYNACRDNEDCLPMLETMRNRGAIVLDHAETFTTTTKVQVSICQNRGTDWHGTTLERMTVPFTLPDEVANCVFSSGLILETLASLCTPVADLLFKFNISIEECSQKIDYGKGNGVWYFKNDMAIYTDLIRGYEGHRNFYRFGLNDFIKSARSDLANAADRAEDDAARLAKEAKDAKAQAEEIRALLASL